MITFAEIQDRIGCMRPTLKPREWQLAFQVAAKRLAVETLALQEVVEFTITANSVYCSVYETADEKSCLYIFKAEWYRSSDYTWIPLTMINQNDLKGITQHAYASPDTMEWYTSDQGAFRPDCPPVTDTQVRAVVAYKPLGDIAEVDFGPEFEDALVEGALAHLLRQPPIQDRDLAGAELSEKRFLSMASSLRGVALVGDVDYARGSTKPTRKSKGFLEQDKLIW